MSLQNGQIVLLALSRLRRKSTVRQVTAEVARCLHVTTTNEMLADLVKVTLEAGVRIGYIRKSKPAYYEPCVEAKNLKFMTRTKDDDNGE